MGASRERALTYLEGNPDVRKRTTTEWNGTLLHGLTESPVCGPKLLQLLIDAGADVNATNNLGWTPRFATIGADGALAAKKADILVQAGAKLDHTAKEGESCLQRAVRFKGKAAVEYLLVKGVKPDQALIARAKEISTPEIVKMLAAAR